MAETTCTADSKRTFKTCTKQSISFKDMKSGGKVVKIYNKKILRLMNSLVNTLMLLYGAELVRGKIALIWFSIRYRRQLCRMRVG